MQCQFCGYEIDAHAKRCLGCLRWLDGRVEPEKRTPRLEADAEPPPRPVAVTAISWLLILGAIAIVIKDTGAFDHRSYDEFESAAIALLCAMGQAAVGFCMLAGRNWARIAYLICAPISILFARADALVTLLALVLYGVAALLLSLPNALEFFKGPRKDDG